MRRILLACSLIAAVIGGVLVLPAASQAASAGPTPNPARFEADQRRHHHRPRPRRTPRPTPIPTPTPTPPDKNGVRAQIRQAWGGDDDKAISVADCESGLNPLATSPGATYLGLWQFSRATWTGYGGAGTDPRAASAYDQTVVAWRLYQSRGWAPWPSCS